jgi:hemolysin activation/secretion protein
MIPGWCRVVVMRVAAVKAAATEWAATLLVAMLMASQPVLAQIPSSELPGRTRERFEELPTPRAQPGGPAISLPSTVAPQGAEQIRLHLRRVVVIGSTVYRPNDFDALTADLVGRQVTLADIYAIAKRITAKYGGDGYILSRAIVPPQELSPEGATVRIQVVEGYVDRVEWPASLSRYRDFFSSYTQKIIADRPTNIRTLERYLLLASDLPGLRFKNSLKPSATQQGAATLVVEVTEKPIDALARIDNRGTRSRGPEQYFGSVTLNNALRMHEAFTASYAGAFNPEELQYAFGGYRQVLTAEGLTFFADGSYSWGKPGLPIDPLLGYKTRSTVFEAGLSYPVIRLRERNLTLSGLGFMTDDQSDAVDAALFRDRMRGVRLKLDADAADSWNGINQVNLVYSQGFNGLGASENGNILASRGNGRVDFSKVEGTVTRVQPLFQNLSALVAAYGQYAFTPLLSSELCGYGGRIFGRGLDPSEIVSDSCAEVFGELRLDFAPLFSGITQTQLYAFADGGWFHNIAPVAGTPENMHAASVGGGIRLGWQSALSEYGGFSTDLSVAKGVDGPRDDWRFFFIVSARH